MNYYIKLVLALSVLAACSSGAVVKRMYSEKTSSIQNEDLEASASGYIYTSAPGHPTSYVQFTSGHSQPLQVVPVYYYTKPQQYVVPQAAPLVAEEPKEELIEEPAIDDKEELIEYNEGGDKEEIQSGGYGGSGGQGGSSGFGEEGGEEYGKAQQSAHGEKGDKGYENKHAFSKGVKGAHGHNQDSGFYKENGGKKAGHYDTAGHYDKHHESEKGSKGEKHGEKKYHKKGQDTKGFHNVYHKDEYKKDHTFYDEADKSGFFKKHGKEASHHESGHGGHEKGGKSNSAYHHDNFGKKGFNDKGHYDNDDEGFQAKKGHAAHHATYSDYAKKGGNNGGAQFGYQYGGDKY